MERWWRRASGYNDPPIFDRWTAFLISHVSAADLEVVKFLVMDAHDSHTHAAAFERLRAANFEPIFICSNASVVQSPPDNRPIAAFRAAYKRAVDDLRALVSAVVPMSVADVNRAIAAAWADVTASGGQAIVHAFAATGMFPLSAQPVNFAPGALSPAFLFAHGPTSPAPAPPAAPLLLPPAGDGLAPPVASLDALHTQLAELTVRCGTLTAENAALRRGAPVHLSLALPPHVSLPPGVPVSPALVFQGAAWAALSQSHILPSQDIARMLARNKMKRKQKLDTTHGLVVTPAVVASLKEREAAADAEVAARAERTEAAKRRKAAGAAETKKAAGGIRLSLIRCADEAALRKALAKILVIPLRAVLTADGVSVVGPDGAQLLAKALRDTAFFHFAPLLKSATCGGCSLSTGEDTMLLCDGTGCAAAWHLACLRPPLASIPSGDWFCPTCATAHAPAVVY